MKFFNKLIVCLFAMSLTLFASSLFAANETLDDTGILVGPFTATGFYYPPKNVDELIYNNTLLLQYIDDSIAPTNYVITNWSNQKSLVQGGITNITPPSSYQDRNIDNKETTSNLIDRAGDEPMPANCPYPPAWPSHPEVMNIVAYYPFEIWGKKFVNFGTDYPYGNVTRFGLAKQNTNNSPSYNTKIESMEIGYDNYTSSGAQCEDYDPLGGAEKFTIMAWVYRNDLSGSTGEKTAARIVADLAGTKSGPGFQFRFGQDGNEAKLYLYINPNDEADGKVAHSKSLPILVPSAQRWVHIAATFDSTVDVGVRTVNFYVDGTARNEGTSAEHVTYRRGQRVEPNDARLTVGCASGGDTYMGQLYGYIDDVIIFRDCVLDVDQINYWRQINDGLHRNLDFDEGIKFGQFNPRTTIYTAEQIIKLVQGKGIDIPDLDKSEEVEIEFGQFDPEVEILSCDSVDNLLDAQ